MPPELYDLHRKGSGQTDLFGSDFAVTIHVEAARLVKTALFQLKLSDENKVMLEGHQLRDASNMELLHKRTFVLAVNPETATFRMESVEKCLKAVKHNHSVTTLRTDGWESVTEWVIAWFNCERGLPSSLQDPKGIEALLEHLKMPEEQNVLDAVWNANWPREILPAKAWLKCDFISEE